MKHEWLKAEQDKRAHSRTLFGEAHVAGKSNPIPLQPGVVGAAIFGGERDEYRYAMVREWDDELPTIMFLMMNPSVANADGDDRTVAKTQVMARRWGYGSVLIGNSFAYRCTDPVALLQTKDPNGPENDKWLDIMMLTSDRIVLACGTPPYPALWPRVHAVADMAQRRGKVPHILRLSKKHQRPEHPLYLPADLVPVPWVRQARV